VAIGCENLVFISPSPFVVFRGNFDQHSELLAQGRAKALGIQRAKLHFITML